MTQYFIDENAVKVMAIINDITFGMYKLADSLDNDTLHRTKIRYKEDPIKLFRRIYPFLPMAKLLGHPSFLTSGSRLGTHHFSQPECGSIFDK